MVYSWTKEAGLANLGRSCLIGELHSGSEQPGEKAMADAFCAHYQYSLLDPGAGWWVGRRCHFPMGPGLGSLTRLCLCQKHTFTQDFAQGYLHSLIQP